MRLTAERKHHDLDSAKNKITSYLTSQGIHIDLVSAVELAFYEALVNIIDHEPRKYIGEPINIFCSVTKSLIKVELAYAGGRFDLTAAKLPDIVTHFRQGKKRGLGVYFIRKLMDTVEYTRHDGINTLTMTKNR